VPQHSSNIKIHPTVSDEGCEVMDEDDYDDSNCAAGKNDWIDANEEESVTDDSVKDADYLPGS
jgi:hypothetical protein